jgi:hypothetical protein
MKDQENNKSIFLKTKSIADAAINRRAAIQN